MNNTSNTPPQTKIDEINSLWSRFDAEFRSEDLYLKSIVVDTKDKATEFIEEFQHSAFTDQYVLEIDTSDKNLVVIKSLDTVEMD